MTRYPAAINDHTKGGDERINSLRSFVEEAQKDPSRLLTQPTGEINNHIHTIYSFSPYSPSMAALLAREAGLCTAGSVDHDSIAAAAEMLAACAVLGIGGCVGFELRVSFRIGADGKAGLFAARKLNNPDSEGYAYSTVQGIPRQFIPAAAEFLAPIRAERLERTRAMTASANALLHEAGFSEIDFGPDIMEKSKYAEGGGITERHLLVAMAGKIILKYPKGPELVSKLKEKLGISLSPRLETLLSDPANPHYLYDLLGVLKAELLPEVFIQPNEEECIPAGKLTAFADSVSGICAYAYLGDVGDSPTGDKKAEKFEDDYIEELFAEISRLGYRAVTYMPPRNTQDQLHRLRELSAAWGFMEISGVDINSSRQSFNCPDVLRKEFHHLLDSNWALIAHERLASVDERYGLFSPNNPLASLELSQRITLYAGLGKKLDLHHPDESAAAIAVELEKGNLY